MKKGVSEKNEYSSVSIPLPLYEKVQKLIVGTGFRSVSEYTNFLLRESVMAWKEEASEPKSKLQENIRKKLESLGYI